MKVDVSYSIYDNCLYVRWRKIIGDKEYYYLHNFVNSISVDSISKDDFIYHSEMAEKSFKEILEGSKDDIEEL